MTEGDRVSDGTIYAGISPNTHKPMFTMPTDETGEFTADGATRHSFNLPALGYEDWRIPTPEELVVLFNNQSAIGNFVKDWYWSSFWLDPNGIEVQQFEDGRTELVGRAFQAHLRCVRG